MSESINTGAVSEVMVDEKNLDGGKGINYYVGKTGEENEPILDPKFGAQQGFRKNVFGNEDNDIINLHSDTKHLSGQVIGIVLQVPKGLNLLEGKTQSWVDSLKVIMEERPDTITGLKGTLTAEFVETDVGGAGEKASQIANMTRERSTPTFTWRDIVGRPIQKMLTFWMEFLLMDPDTKIPKVNTLSNYKLDTWTKDYQSMTMMFIELDQSGMYVDRSWLITDMMPTTNGAVEGRRNLMEAATPLDLEILFTGVTVQGLTINAMATELLHEMTYIRTDTEVVNGAFKRQTAIEEDEDIGFNGRATEASMMSDEFGISVPSW